MPSLQEQAANSADQYGVPQSVFFNLINVESGWNPNASGQAGEVGLTQINPSIHTGVDAYDTSSALDYTAKTLRQYYDEFGSWSVAVAAWNAGEPNVRKAGGVPSYSQDYVNKIVGGGNVPTLSSQPVPGAVENDTMVLRYATYVIATILLVSGYVAFKGR